MSKRKVQFSAEVKTTVIEEHIGLSGDEVEPEGGDGGRKFGKKFKHTLDSDEEDDEVIDQNYNVLDTDQIDGQEEATVESDGGIAITPFNMKEELEEGHFDKEGNYIFDKTEEIRDSWLDGIDWVRIKEGGDKNGDKDDNEDKTEDKKEEKEEEEEEKAEIDVNEIYKQMIELMEPKESVQKAIQRLGKSCGKTKTSDRWKKKQEIQLTEEQKVAKEKLLKLTSLADQILLTGDMDIYERTYEQLSFHLKKKSEMETSDNDMFADDFDSKKVSNNEDKLSNDGISNEEVQWEFKWEDKDSAEVFGPHSSSQMLGWVKDGYFDNGVYVRQVGKSDAQFYTSKRIDFDLYT